MSCMRVLAIYKTEIIAPTVSTNVFFYVLLGKGGYDLFHPFEEILLFATRGMDLKSVILTEISQVGKEKNHMISFIYRI